MDTSKAYFVIADISGYTGYLANNELEHAQGILAEITDLLIEKLGAPLRFVELEGDAVFAYAPDTAVDDAERLIDMLEAAYAGFKLLQEQMVSSTTCTCNACRAIKDLDLKCVSHYGDYLPQQTPTGTKLVGKDVIATHRLLKNSIIERTGVEAYAFLSDEFLAKTDCAEISQHAPGHTECYEELGEITGRVVDLADAVARYTGAERHYVRPEDADVMIVNELPAPPSVVWAYHIDAARRHQWQLDTVSVANAAAGDGRTGIGTLSHCDHGSYRLDHRIVDWRPFDYMTMDTTSRGTTILKPPACIVTFAFEPLDGNRTRASMRIRAHDRRLRTLVPLKIMTPLLRRQWQGHYSVLKKLLGEGSTPDHSSNVSHQAAEPAKT